MSEKKEIKVLKEENLNKISGGSKFGGFDTEYVSKKLKGEAKTWWDANQNEVSIRAAKAGMLFEYMSILYETIVTNQISPSLNELKQIISSCGIDISDL